MLCDRVQSDPATGKTTAFGIFDRITASGFPVKQPDCGVYVNLTGLNGRYLFEMLILAPDLQTEVVRFPLEQRIASNDPLQRFVAGMNIQDLIWPASGKYTLRLLYNGLIADETTVLLEAKP